MIGITKNRLLLAGWLFTGLSLCLLSSGRLTHGQTESGTGNKQFFEVVSNLGGFSAKFSVQPQKTVSDKRSPFGNISLTQYEAKSPTSYQLIGFYDLPFSMTAEGIKKRYDNSRNGVLTESSQQSRSNGTGGQGTGIGGRRLIAENDFYLGERLGREIVVEDSNPVTVIQRFLLVEKRMYVLIFGTPRRFSNMPKAEQDLFRRAADEFFNSFALTKTPTPQIAGTEFPAVFGLKREKNVLTSSYFGFSITLPSNLTILTPEETQLMMGMTNKISEEKMKTEGGYLSSASTTKPLVIMVKKPFREGSQATFSMMAQRVNLAPGFKPFSMLKIIERFTSVQPGKKITKGVQTLMLGGVEFAFLEIFDSNANFKQRLYATNRKDFSLEITLAFHDEADAAAMENALKTIRFK